MPQNEKMDFTAWKKAREGMIPLTLSLCFVLGWQGGTVHQVAEALQVSTLDILNADETQAGELLRKAQQIQREESQRQIVPARIVNDNAAGEPINTLLLKHLRVCVDNLKIEYAGHDIPHWLERASGVLKIASESVAA